MIISKLKAIMDEKAVTYEKLQELTGISSQTITRAPRIVECSLGKLEAMAWALGVTTKELYEDDGKPASTFPILDVQRG